MGGNRLRTASLAIVAVSLAVSMFMWAHLSGFEYGFFYGVFRNPPSDGFAAHGPNYYQSLNAWYFSISLCLSFVMTAKFFRHTIVSGVLCILLLAFITVSTGEMIEYKNLVIAGLPGYSSLWFDPYPWLNSSIYFDGFCIFAFVVLLVIEIWMMRSVRVSSESTAIEL
jgi:hypothetical protein